MHDAARDFIRRQVSHFSVLEIGSLDVNGGIRDLFAGWDYLGIDRIEGNGVDVVADGATFETSKRFDVVVSCEAFEHTDNWRAVVVNVARLLRPGGYFFGTAAGPGRPPHKCNGKPLKDRSEWYENIEPVELTKCLEQNHFIDVIVEQRMADVRWSARKPV